MLKSLFGDLGMPRRSGDKARDSETAVSEPPVDDQGFAATAVLETVVEEEDPQQPGTSGAERHATQLLISRGSAAQAMRQHFVSTRTDDAASRQITLFDPASAWAGAVIKALSDATGGPIERLHLRERSSQHVLATIERTTLVRRNEDTLKVYHADMRGALSADADIAVTLLERSQLAVVIVGPLAPPAIETMASALLDASRQPTWHCPNLLFLVPPGAAALSNYIAALPWPAWLRVQVQDDPLTSASAVWNTMLAAWNAMTATGPAGRSGATDEAASPSIPPFSLGTPTADEPNALPSSELSPHDGGAPLTPPRPRLPFDTARAARALASMAAVEGLIACAVVHATSGLVLARHEVDDGSDTLFDLDLAAAAGAQVLRAHRLASPHLGMPAPLEEVAAGDATRLFALRPVTHHPELFLFALLDRQRANFSLARFKLMEVERLLA